MNYYAIVALINTLTSTILGFIVYYKNRKEKVNIAFGLFCLSVSVWSYCYFFWQIAENANNALFWSRMLMFGAIYVPVTYLHFVIALLDLVEKKKIFLIKSYLFFTIFSLFNFTPLFVKTVEPELSFPYWPKPGIVYHPFLFVWILYMGYCIYLLYTNYKKSLGIKREQIKFVFLGIGFALLGASTNYFLWYDIKIPPIGNILVLAYVGFTAYAIIRHRLMDLKIVLRKSSVYLASLLTVIIFALIINYEISNFFPESAFWRDFLIIILAISTFGPIKMYYYYLANKYFFSSLYDSQAVISDLSDKLRTTLELNRIYDFIYIVLADAFHFKAFGILVYGKKANEYFLRYNQGFVKGDQIILKNDAIFKTIFTDSGQSFLIEEIKREHNFPDAKKIVNLLENYKIEVLAPLNIKDKATSYIILGPKESGDIYNDEDLLVLKIICSQAAIAIENAMLYEETRNFNIKLKDEVEKATADLRVANRKLKKLDEAKSEFISIASHQLRTPLTIIKGFISMLLENDFGQLSQKQKDPMEKVYESNERLISMVENLLNISRIESGRLQFNYEDVDVGNFLAEVVNELSSNAVKKGLELIYAPPAGDLPLARIDKEKIRQVIMNLIDNAIKYSHAGKITVTASKIHNDIKVCVADNGIGIKKEDFQNLFKKFSRNSTGLVVNTEGTGLGLYVAKQMIDAHNGKIWAESPGADQGSIFCFTLPINNSALSAKKF